MRLNLSSWRYDPRENNNRSRSPLYLVLPTLTGAALIGTSEPALAACMTTGSPSGTTVVCTGSSGPLNMTAPPTTSPVTVDNVGSFNGGMSFTNIGVVGVTNHGSMNDPITFTGGQNFTFEQAGTFGSATITATSTGTNTLVVHAGRSVNAVTFTGQDNAVDNSGTLNTTITLTAAAQNYLINRTGGQINTAIFNGSANTIDNDGRFNNGISFTGSGQTNVIQNRQNGTINSITSTGVSVDRVHNRGTINGAVALGDGDDWFVNLGQSGTGTVAGTVNLGAGRDIFYLEDGTITSPVDLGSGNDWAAILNGTLSSNFIAGDGNDSLNWAGGRITSGLDMGTGDDHATFYDLTQANLLTGMQIRGGLGNDVLTWRNTVGQDVYRYLDWELIELSRNSEMIFSNYSTLTLGDAATGTGRMTIDATSRISAGGGTHTVSPATGGLVRIENAGVIDLTNGPVNNTDRFVINGNYLGQNGWLSLHTFLGADDSPSDQLVIRGAGARAAGDTMISITNVGGPGAPTVGNGIRVVDADIASGATTDADAFTLAGPVGAGVFEYLLYYGGVGADTGDQDWYLRSVIPVTPTPPVPAPLPPAPPPPPPTTPLPPAPEPLPPTPPPPTPPLPPDPADPDPQPPIITVPPPVTTPAQPTPEPLPPGPDPLPAAPPPPPISGPPEIPVIRPEIPGYVVAPSIANQMGILALDTFHARRGDELLLDNYGTAPSAWARLFGRTVQEAWTPSIENLDFALDPDFSGQIGGLQAGLDLVGLDRGEDGQDRLGLFFTHTTASGGTTGYVLGVPDTPAGTLNLNGESLGAYWTHIHPDGWYVDAIAMGTLLHGGASSYRGIGANLSGHALLASLETGYAFDLAQSWTIEPQAQLIWQNVSINDSQDPFTTIGYGDLGTLTGRLGLRLEGNLDVDGMKLQPFADINLWHNFASSMTVAFNDRTVTTPLGGTSLEIGGGLAAELSDNVSVYGAVRYMTNLSGQTSQGIGGNVGLRVKW